MKKIETMSNAEILDALESDGANISKLCEITQADPSTLAQILRAADKEGALVWTTKHIVSTHKTCPFEYLF